MLLLLAIYVLGFGEFLEYLLLTGPVGLLKSLLIFFLLVLISFLGTIVLGGGPVIRLDFLNVPPLALVEGEYFLLSDSFDFTDPPVFESLSIAPNCQFVGTFEALALPLGEYNLL